MPKPSKPQTKKPCPLCKEVRWRDADDVCTPCRRQYQEYQALLKEEEERQSEDTVVRKMPWAPHALKYATGSTRGESGFEAAFMKVLTQVGTLSLVHWHHAEDLAAVKETTYEKEPVRRFRASALEALEDLYQAHLDQMTNAYKEGRKAGQSLLLNIADGTVSMEDLNRRSVKS